MDDKSKIDIIYEEMKKNYDFIMLEQEKNMKNYFLKSILISIILYLVYLYFNYVIIIYIIWLLIISNIANLYKLSWYKEWFKDWYLDAKWFDSKEITN